MADDILRDAAGVIRNARRRADSGDSAPIDVHLVCNIATAAIHRLSSILEERDAALDEVRRLREELEQLKNGQRACANERCGQLFTPRPSNHIFCCFKCNNATTQRRKLQRLSKGRGDD